MRRAGDYLWLLAGVPAGLCWVLIAWLAYIEAIHVWRDEFTEHSPLLVLAYVLGPAVLLTWAAVALRRATRRRPRR